MLKAQVTRKLLECLQCGWKWFPRSTERPDLCPNVHCHSPKWDKERES